MTYRTRPTTVSEALLGLTCALIMVGVVMNVSTSATLTGGSGGPWWTSGMLRQSAFSFLAFAALLLFSRLDYRAWLGPARHSLWPSGIFLALALIACLLVLVPGIGVERNGAQRWIRFGPASAGMTLQPSEICKPALVVFLAAYLALRGARIRQFIGGLLPALLVIALCAAIVGLEDFGTAALLAVVGAGMLWSSGASRRQLLLCALPGIIGLAGLIAMKPYRVQRLMGFMNVYEDRQGAGYHAVQSLMAIATGGWWGSGLGASVQKYGYLPEARSDFVFAVICEELGFAGALAVIGLFVALVWQGGRALRRADGRFGELLVLGATLTVGLQAAINIGVVTVTLPTKGIALPFISAGGSSVLFLSLLVGWMASVARERVAVPTIAEAADAAAPVLESTPTRPVAQRTAAREPVAAAGECAGVRTPASAACPLPAG